jgi:parvulin-like peptidyl-prolyl isomerase
VSQGQHAEEGGDHGWMRLEGLRPELREAILTLQPGQVSDLILTPVQYYIVKVEGRRGGDMPELAAVQSKLEAELRGRIYDRLYRDWINGLKKQFPIQRFSTREPGT